MGDIINGVASEYEMPRESKFYSENSKLPKTNCNIPMPNVKSQANNGDRICDTCNKEDVCMYKGELAQAAKEITQISERENVFINTDIRCKKWSSKESNYENLHLCPKVQEGISYPKCIMLKEQKYCSGIPCLL